MNQSTEPDPAAAAPLVEPQSYPSPTTLSTRPPIASPLAIAVAAAFIVFIAVVFADVAATSAAGRESLGLTRGAIVDRSGHPLAYTALVANQAQRLITLPDLAPIVGYQGPNDRWYGLESAYSGVLENSAAQRDWRSFFLHLSGRSVAGGRVRLTIDRSLQQAADTALGPHRGAVVALDPATGAVLAMVTKPYCTPATLRTVSGLDGCRRNPGQPLLDRATQRLVAPGSAFKIVTLTAALATHRFSLQSVFSGADIFGPSPYFNSVEYPSNITRSDLSELTLAQALAFSDNFTFAHIGLTLGAPTWLTYAHRYLLGRRIPFDRPVAESVAAYGMSHPTASVLARSSFGARPDKVTPLQMALITATVANGGVMMAPHLVADTETAGGRVLTRFRVHALAHVMSRAAAREVAAGMTFVVDHGSGFPAQIAGIKVAGKTGTAADNGNQPHAWFIAFAPVQHPVVAVAVLREYAGEGFKYAAPVARQVLVAALRERGYKVR